MGGRPRTSAEDKKIKKLAWNKAYKERHRERILEEKKEYYQKVKDNEEYKAYGKAAKAKQYAENKGFCDTYKLEKGCLKCGENSSSNCLVFHHREPENKSFTISTTYNSKNLNSIKNEISKCDILCQNCHLKIHFNEDWEKNIMSKESRRAYVERRDFAEKYKSENGCKICKEKDYRCLQFHHINPKEKLIEVSILYKRKSKIFLNEIEKCEILCGNCHMKLHHDK